MKMYTVYDVKATAHLTPFFCVNDAVAKRVFSVACTDATHQFASHPHDFTMYCIGEFDPDTGSMKLLKNLVEVATALDIVNSAIATQENLDIQQAQEKINA